MGQIAKDLFVCLDCESTGLDPKIDRIIEVGAIQFTFDKIENTFETLIDPQCEIPKESQEIHNISQEMVKGKPTICEILPSLLEFLKDKILIGHGIPFDLSLLFFEAKRCQIPCDFSSYKIIDTLRLARLYGESPSNSLEQLRHHFNIPAEGAHRAMNDVIVNIEVFKYLAKKYKTTEELLSLLQKPILLKYMPLGKHRGRKFDEIPLEYLLWASHKDFDQDLLFSLHKAIQQRKKGTSFSQASNPFSAL